MIDSARDYGTNTAAPSEQYGIMIDSPTTRDRDDAIWLNPHELGVDLWVHVADVAAHVTLGSYDDGKARRQCHTRYLPDRVIGMLPTALEAAATLRPDADQPTLAIGVTLDHTLEPHAIRVQRGRLMHAHQLTYAQVTDILADSDHRLNTTLGQAKDLAHALLKRRRRDGALAFYDLYKGYATTEEGTVIRLADHQRHIGYLIVQEFMIAANAAVARWAAQQDLPILYRNHRTSAVAGDNRAILDDLAVAQGSGDAAAYELLRERLGVVQRAAEYGPTVLGHQGLNLSTYTHATSPLRRYADLVNQRMLLACVDGEAPPYTADELAVVADEINEQTRIERRRRAERHRNEAKRTTRRRLEAPEYHHLTEADFGKVLRMGLAEKNVPAGLITETGRRCSAAELSMRDRYELLLNARSRQWHPIRERIHREVAAEPGNALTILNMYAQADSGQPHGGSGLEWDVEPIGTVHQPCFGARVTITVSGRVISSPQRNAASKKDAKAQAALALVGRLSELPDLSDNTSAPRPAAPRTPRVPADRGAMMAVNEYTQTGVITVATWSFHREGRPHEPVFTGTVETTVTATGRVLRATASANTKQGAKNEAAKDLRTHIEHELDRFDPVDSADTTDVPS
ncbi:MAG TPA: RNB domain-containing ribonuclease [Candidatus Stackebrandtia excrementipullorum]|nr:RNB domain-containing ribonuclease [Candidatus Stackebrandtia excrementipullorum]